MNHVVQNALSGKEVSPASSPVPVTVKPCRYGLNCTRVGCRFKHAGRDPEPAAPVPAAPPASSSSTASTSTSTNHLYYSNSWIPHNIEISLNKLGELKVEKVDSVNGDGAVIKKAEEEVKDVEKNGEVDETPKENEEKQDEKKSENPAAGFEYKEQKMQYSLTAVVCYVDDKNNEDRRNLVAFIRVPPKFHLRSSGSPVCQWYIFNDFWYL